MEIMPANPVVEERNLLSVPMYHIAGIQAMLASVYGGRTLVLMRQFEVKEWIKNYRRMQRIIKEVSKLSMAIIHHNVPESRGDGKNARRRSPNR